MQSLSGGEPVSHVTVSTGVPLHIGLDRRASYSKPGHELQGHLLKPVYVGDAIAIPAGTEVLGRVTGVVPVSKQKRFDALAGGDFTPLKVPQVEFYAIVQDGKEVPIQSSAATRDSVTVEMASSAEKKGLWQSLKSDTAKMISSEKRSMEGMISKPHKTERLRNAMIARLPYHPQVFEEGTQFVAELSAPLEVSAGGLQALRLPQTTSISARPPADSILHARLTSELSSATNHWGDAVDAVLTEPVFAADHRLLLPEGTHLIGSVTHADSAKKWGRNGQLSFTFKQIQMASGEKLLISGRLEAVEANRTANLKLDQEGNSHATESRAKHLAPLALVMLAQSSSESDGDGMNGSERGSGNSTVSAGGFGLMGRLLALSAGSRYIAYGIGYYGAARSIYTGFIGRGKEVVFPRNTQMEIRVDRR